MKTFYQDTRVVSNSRSFHSRLFKSGNASKISDNELNTRQYITVYRFSAQSSIREHSRQSRNI